MNALFKDFIREIKKTKSRFISILLITTLGVGFFVGIRVTGLDMQKTADVYFDEYSLLDIKIMSNYGLTETDISEISKLNNVESVLGAYYTDVLIQYNEKPYVIKMHSFSDDIITENLNVPQLISGKFPEKENECVLEDGFFNEHNMSLNDKIVVSETGNVGLKEKELVIVGTVKWVQYLTFDYGTSTLGTGSVSTFGLLHKSGFNSKVFTEAHIKLSNVEGLSCYSNEYKNKIKNFKTEIIPFVNQREANRLTEIKKEAYEEIHNAEDKLKKEENNANNKIHFAENKIKKKEQELKFNQIKLNEESKNFKNTITQNQNTLNQQYAEYEKHKKSFIDTLSENSLTEENLPIKAEEIQNQIDQLFTNGYTEETEEIIALKNQLEPILELLQTKTTLDSWKSNLDTSQSRLNKTKAETEALLNKNQTKINNGLAEIEKAKKQISNQKTTLSKEIANAEKEIDKSYADINELEESKWYILDRRSNESFFSYEQDADRIVSVAKVFPLFFFLVAALVCLTSMTRMVEEQRTQLGTLKALGYSRNAIAFKFIAYAMTASLIGSILGLIIGFYFIPEQIYDAYRILYKTPDMIAPIYFEYVLIAILLGIGSTVIAAYFASIAELKAVAADLMRPKSPKIGKKILIEKIPFIWDKISFTWKVTIRNLIRYKKRLIMTVFGVGACVALLIAGIGLRYSISSIVDLQYGSIVSYDMLIQTENDLKNKDMKNIEKMLSQNEKIKSFTWARSEYMKIVNGDRSFDISIVVPMNENKIYKYINFINKSTNKTTKIPNDGVLITTRIADIYGINEGDYIILKDNDDHIYKLKVTEIIENYVFHYIYLSENYYEKIFNKKPTSNEIMLNISTEDETEFNNLSENLLKNKNITSITFTKNKKDSFADSLGNMDFVIIIVILAAGALGFIVLYNLDNINVSERKREFATLKVLGFYPGELHLYVVRENIVLTFLGILLGFPMGKYLHSYLMKTVSVDFVQFYPDLLISSYLTAAILTLFFALLVNIILARTLKKIDMIDSLKSVE